MKTAYRFKLSPNGQQAKTLLDRRPKVRAFISFCLAERTSSYEQTVNDPRLETRGFQLRGNLVRALLKATENGHRGTVKAYGGGLLPATNAYHQLVGAFPQRKGNCSKPEGTQGSLTVPYSLFPSLVKTLIIFAVFSSLAACTNKTAQQNSPNSSTGAASSPSAASSQTLETSAKATKIEVSAKEMAFQLSSSTAPSGPVEFVVKNIGKEPHEFVVLKNERPDKTLPLKGDSLDEQAQGFKNLGEISENKLKSGATETLKVNLTPGRYLLVCNLPGHFKAGMKADFIVK